MQTPQCKPLGSSAPFPWKQATLCNGKKKKERNGCGWGEQEMRWACCVYYTTLRRRHKSHMFPSVTVSQWSSTPPAPPCGLLHLYPLSGLSLRPFYKSFKPPFQAPPSGVLSPASSYPRSANPLWMHATSVLMPLNPADQWGPPHNDTIDPGATIVSHSRLRYQTPGEAATGGRG